MTSGGQPEFTEWEAVQVVEVEDERTPLARGALSVIRDTFPPHDRQPLDHIRMEITERRLGISAPDPYHLLAAVSDGGQAMAVAAGVYLSVANAGLVTYLGARAEHRARKLGRRIRAGLVQAFEGDALRIGRPSLGWVVGEVRVDNPWLGRLVRDRGAIPFDLTYYHPGVGPGWSDEQWVLYRQPVGDHRPEIPVAEVRRLIYAIWRRAYRVRWPLEHDGFAAMVEELSGREVVGVHPAYAM